MISGIQRVVETFKKYKKTRDFKTEMQTPPPQVVPAPSAPRRPKSNTRTVFVFRYCHYRQMEYVHWLILSHVDLARVGMITTNHDAGMQMIVKFDFYDRVIMTAMEQIIVRSEFEVVDRTIEETDNIYYCHIK